MRVRASGDTMLLVELEPVIDPLVNERAIRLAERLRERTGASVRDIVPAYCTVGVHFDPLRTDLGALERVIAEEARRVDDLIAAPERPPLDIPVRYGGEGGPDLTAVAEWSGLSPEEVVRRHTGRVYRVYMLGFVPGFAYMGRVDEAIAAPRHRIPREQVPAGTVGIAGAQTGVYPMVTPGGWQLIGRTECVMFDATRSRPSLVAPGDFVRFVDVGRVR